MTEAIDFVIPWVDGNDPAWQKERDNHASNEGDQREIRFREWDNLNYLFRGIEKFAPWVNKVFFVTWGHLPVWLNTEHPKLVIVKHKDYIPSEYLPTFNSHTIELNLHRIKDLSMHFVYFNDDIFLLQPMEKEEFFKAGLPLDCGVLMPNISLFRNSTACIAANNMEVINTTIKKNQVIRKFFFKWINPVYRKHLLSTVCSMPYKQFVGFYNPHIAFSFLKTSFIKMWETEKDLLHRTCMNRFRSGHDVNQWLIRYWQLVTGQFVPRSTTFSSCFSLTNNNEDIVKKIKEQEYKMICLNDNERELIVNFEKEKDYIKQAFEEILPEKSLYEL